MPWCFITLPLNCKRCTIMIIHFLRLQFEFIDGVPSEEALVPIDDTSGGHRPSRTAASILHLNLRWLNSGGIATFTSLHMSLLIVENTSSAEQRHPPQSSRIFMRSKDSWMMMLLSRNLFLLDSMCTANDTPQFMSGTLSSKTPLQIRPSM